MMTKEEIEISKELVRHPNFRWAGGMGACRAEDPLFFDRIDRIYPAPPGSKTPSAANIPDISHPATKGCLLALARELCGRPDLHCSNFQGGISVRSLWTIQGFLRDPSDTTQHAVIAPTEGIALAKVIMERSI